jgi:hypothetical protein
MDVSVRRREVSWNLRPKASLPEEMEGTIGHRESYQARHDHLKDRLKAGAACEQDEKISGEIESGRSAIDPNIPLCPYELAGLCLNPYCAYQHPSIRPLVNILSRELLPLPHFLFQLVLASLGGIGLQHLYVEQGCQKISALLQHIRQQSQL